MKEKLINISLKMKAVSRILKSDRWFLYTSKDDKYQVVHTDIPLENVKDMVSYLNVKVIQDYNMQKGVTDEL